MTTESRGWTRYDKLAGLAALALLSGYYVDPIQAAVGTGLHAILAPAAALVPFSVLILLLAGTTGVSSAILNVKLRNQDRMDDLQERMADLRERLDSARERDDEDTIEDLRAEQQDVMMDWMSAMKTQLRPAAWSMLISIPTFLWLRWVFLAPSVAVAPAAFALPLVGHVAWTATVIGPLKVWLVWYVGCSISTGIVARKVAARVAG
ncbi:DUF106 domain-containing protein [Halorussus amylolyticus]|uniref:DUF106 domain-containing protein n=1 Tax=Halorussus amylolyticus TaxID=1126242 RepID=UPI00104ADCF5|nr:EMC3/TMCO1 family protein [Halorussus amylolyticus]